MSTTGKLWLGYGLLLSLMIGIGLYVAHRLTRIDEAITIIASVRDPSGEAAFPMQVDLHAGSEAVLQYVTRGQAVDRARARARFAAFEARLARQRWDNPAGSLAARADAPWRALRQHADSLIQVSDQLRTAESLRTDAANQLARTLAPPAASPEAGDAATRAVLSSGRIAVHQARARDVRSLTATRDTLLTRFTAARTAIASQLDARIRAVAQGDPAGAQAAARRAVQSSVTALLLLLGAGIVMGAATAFPTGVSIVQAERRLLEQREELALAHRRKDEFLALMSHELRNPLAPISNALFVLQSRSRGLPEDVRQAHDMMRRQIEHVTRLVDDLLNVSRISEGKITLQREPVELNTVVARAARAVPTTGPNPRRLELDVPRDSVWVDGDPVRIAQVLGNLIHNAVQYTPTGGRITLRLARENHTAVLTVADDGAGIPPALLERIFEPFVQAEPVRDRGGLGIGLTLVKRLVELHGGQVTAMSEGAGKGSTFTVRLPAMESPPPAVTHPTAPSAASTATDAAARATAGANAASAAADAASGHRARTAQSTSATTRRPQVTATGDGEPEAARPCRILVVDDSRDGAETMAELLRMWGHEVVVAFDGESAVRMADQHHPDLVLLDIALPGIDGYQVAEMLRARPGGAQVRLVAITGFGQPEDRERARSAGFDEHVTKPVPPHRLRDLLIVRRRM